jgi:hypothetical protein
LGPQLQNVTYLLHVLGCICHVALSYLRQSNTGFLTLTCLLRSGKVSTETGGKVSTEMGGKVSTEMGGKVWCEIYSVPAAHIVLGHSLPVEKPLCIACYKPDTASSQYGARSPQAGWGASQTPDGVRSKLLLAHLPNNSHNYS